MKACVWLACKTEEQPRDAMDIVRVFQRIFKRTEGQKLDNTVAGSTYAGKSKYVVESERLSMVVFVQP